MSTQSSGHAPVPFSITTPLRNVRLMEVPDDLLELIEVYENELKFKSAPPVGGKEGVVYLCSGSKAWAVRQVSTSNSVYVMRPTGDGDADMDMDLGDGEGGPGLGRAMTASSKVGSFLELGPVVVEEASVWRDLVGLLPAYHPLDANEEQDLELLASNEAKVSRSWDGVVDDIAAPDRVVIEAGVKMCVVEFEDQRGLRCQIPSTRVLLGVWSKIVEGCAIRDIKLDGNSEEWKILKVLDDEAQAKIADQMFRTGGWLESLDMFQTGTSRQFDVSRMSRLVAGLVLSSRQPGADGKRSMDRNDFLSTWANLLPVSYMKHCTVEKLMSSSPTVFEVVEMNDGKEVIRWVGGESSKTYVLPSALVDTLSGGEQVRAPEAAAAAKPVAASSAAADKKRKWHEKFGAQRNTKR